MCNAYLKHDFIPIEANGKWVKPLGINFVSTEDHK